MEDKKRLMNKRALKLFAQGERALARFEETGDRTAFRAWQDQCGAFEEEFGLELEEARQSIADNRPSNKVKKVRPNVELEEKEYSKYKPPAEVDPVAALGRSLDNAKDAIASTCIQEYGTVDSVKWWQFWRWRKTFKLKSAEHKQKLVFLITYGYPDGTRLAESLSYAGGFVDFFRFLRMPCRVCPQVELDKLIIRLPRYTDQELRGLFEQLVKCQMSYDPDNSFPIELKYDLFWWQRGYKYLLCEA